MKKNFLFLIAPTFLAGLLTACGSNTPETKTLSELKVALSDDSKEYYVGDQFSKSDLNVTALYSDGTSDTIMKSDYTVSIDLPYTFSADDVLNGKQFDITYLNLNKSLTVTVKEETLVSIEAATKLDEYAVGEVFTKSDLNVVAIYNSGRKKTLNSEEYSVSPTLSHEFINGDKDGIEFTITYQDKTCKVNPKVVDQEEIDVYEYFDFRLGGGNNVCICIKDYETIKSMPKGTLNIPETVDGQYVIGGTAGTSYTVYSIDFYSFYGCSSIISIKIPKTINSIGSSYVSTSVFADCSSLATIVVDEENTVFDSRDNCNGIIEKSTNTLVAGCKNTVIPETVTKISQGAFSGSTSLTSIEIPNSITTIESGTFDDCILLSSVKIPASVTSIGGYYGVNPFIGCISLKNITIESGNTVYDSRDNCNAIIKTASNELIVGCKNTTIPDDVTSVGDYAFNYCTSLTSIVIPKSVTSIYSYAFEGCSSLSKIVVEEGNSIYDSRDNSNAIIETSTNTLVVGCKNTVIPNSVTTIGEDAFYGCDSLTSIEIPNSITTIDDGAFYYCTSLKSISIPKSVTTIGDGVFYGCESLVSIDIPDSITNISNGAFKECISLTTINIPNSVSKIEASAFSGCTSLASINIPNSVTSIGKSAFSECSSLTSINIPNSVKEIGESVFNECTSLESINISNSVEKIGYNAFYKCTSLSKIDIPNSITSIPYFAFGYCTSLTSITISNSVELIDAFAFSNCTSLTSIEIPESVTSLGNYAFYQCSSLSTIDLSKSNKLISAGKDLFKSCNLSAGSIKVPSSLLSAYQSASNWSSYSSYMVGV